MPQWILIPKVEGKASREAHADLPPDTYERELGKDGFYGPSTQMYHRHAPTGWSDIDGPLRPRAFDTAQLARQNPSPWDSDLLLSNDAMQLRLWRTDTSMDHLVRNGDGDELLFIHEGMGDCSATTGICQSPPEIM